MKAKVLPLSFFRRPAEVVAQEILGAILVRREGSITRLARIVETEAYVGRDDLACHASKGCTPRTSVMFESGGRSYVYLIYGMYEMLNAVTSKKGDPQAVLFRAAEPYTVTDGRLLSFLGKRSKILPAEKMAGPGKLTRALDINRALNGLPFTRDEPLFFIEGPPAVSVVTTTRIGVDYAGSWKDAPLRFYEKSSPFISKP